MFTVGELGTTLALALIYQGGPGGLRVELAEALPSLFWLFLGGFCWVLGDLFQQYAAKYIGISRGIPLSNTNQLWGLAWGALVFGELVELGVEARLLVVVGSLIMIVGAAAIGLAEAPASERSSWRLARERGGRRYGLDPSRSPPRWAGKGRPKSPRGVVPGGSSSSWPGRWGFSSGSA